MSTLQVEEAAKTFLETWGIPEHMDWASLVLPCITDKENKVVGCVFVIDTIKPVDWVGPWRARWKLPGGKRSRGDKSSLFDNSPADTASRELKEETNLPFDGDEMDMRSLHLSGHHRAKNGSHEKFFFSVRLQIELSRLAWPKWLGDDDEQPRFFPIDEAKRLIIHPDFLYPHSQKLREYKMLE